MDLFPRILFLVTGGLLAPTLTLTAGDWPCWRGPSHNGIAAPNQNPPLDWSETENVCWKTPLPGRGHGSPIVVGDFLYLATADETAETRSLLCLDRRNGRLIWNTTVHRGLAVPARNKKGTQASSTPACDGQRLFINFLHDGAMVTSALSMKGEILWQRKITDYIVHQGFGSSPIVHGSLVIVSADNKSGGALAGLDRTTGNIIWRIERPEKPNYPSPVIVQACGKTQLIMIGCDRVSSFHPLTGKTLWEIDGATTECVTSTVTNGELIYTSGGYPKNHVAAVRADGSGTIVWENSTRVYVPSMLLKDGFLYAVADNGFAVCWNASTGKEQWKGRLGGTFSSSPVLVGNRIFATNEEGRTFLFRASPHEFEKLGENSIPGECLATPAICDSRIYLRIAKGSGESRQEYLYCLGKTGSSPDNLHK